MVKNKLSCARTAIADIGKIVGAVVALTCQGCSFSYTDTHGDVHVIGLVDVAIHRPEAPETLAGDVVEITSLGVAAGTTPQGSFLAVGYNHEATAVLRNNVLVTGNPVLISHSSAQ
jgi:hypothetical protein